jgi:hypothetical protein
MLRSKHGIIAENCVTHAQVSVNPANGLIGYHTDWASNFPFEAMGLPDNYSRPLPAIWAFGFEADPAFLQSTGSGVWRSVVLAEDELRQRARLHGARAPDYRTLLRQRYRQNAAAVRSAGPQEENSNELE